MSDLKPISKDAVSRAVAKAERYRLLNEPREAESICRDVLAVDPANHDATACLILAMTDLFHVFEVKPDDARALLARLPSDYERRYYAGVIDERWGKALLLGGYQPEVAFGFFRSAMNHYEAAEAIASEGNDDAVLRWNACVRIIERYGLAASEASAPDELDAFDDDVPVR